DESEERLPAEKRRAVQRRGEANRVLRRRPWPHRRCAADGHLGCRRLEVSPAAAHRHHAVQKAIGCKRLGRDAMFSHLVTPVRIVAIVVAIVAAIARPATAQTELAGSWAARNHEDGLERGGGPYAVDYTGLPLNDEARAKAL